MTDIDWMRLALGLARRGRGRTSPNPMVGAVLVQRNREIGRGWHHRAGDPHAEIEAIADAVARGAEPAGATLYVTLEPCATRGRTPPCTEAIRAVRIQRVVVGAIDPNPKHQGRGVGLLQHAGIDVGTGVLEPQCTALNSAFNHWIVHHTPFTTVKAAMTLDGKIATGSGQSKWITGIPARHHAMRLRLDHDAILVGIETILADDPELTIRRNLSPAPSPNAKPAVPLPANRPRSPRRIVLDARARTPLSSRIFAGDHPRTTTIVVGEGAPARRVKALAERGTVLVAPTIHQRINLCWLLGHLGSEEVTSLLVEGGGEIQGSFLLGGFAHRIAFYYAPKILGGGTDRKAVGGAGARTWSEMIKLTDPHWRRLGVDLFLGARVLPLTS